MLIKFTPQRRRFWAAKIIHWAIPQPPKFEMGEWKGGIWILNCCLGDLVRWGTRAHSKWGVVEAHGSVREITKVEARELWLKFMK